MSKHIIDQPDFSVSGSFSIYFLFEIELKPAGEQKQNIRHTMLSLYQLFYLGQTDFSFVSIIIIFSESNFD
jgi:hypothetical protein